MARWFPGQKISAIHGKAKYVDGRVVVAMFHPAAALHQRSLRSLIEEDFRRLPEIIKSAQGKADAQPAPQTKDDGAGEQLSLF
jgi:DNA polymerase